jgi:hypothetical protein
MSKNKVIVIEMEKGYTRKLLYSQPWLYIKFGKLNYIRFYASKLDTCRIKLIQINE